MRKIQAMLLVSILVTCCYLVPVRATTEEIQFTDTWEDGSDHPSNLDLSGTSLLFEFYFKVTHTKPSLLFGGTEPYYIYLEPDRSHIEYDPPAIYGDGWRMDRDWGKTLDGVPIGGGTLPFRFDTPAFEDKLGIEALLIVVSANIYVKYSATGRLLASGTLAWDEAGKKSINVTAPSGIGEEEIRTTWYYKWKFRFGVDFVNSGEKFGDWIEMGELKTPESSQSITYGWGSLLIGLFVVVAILITSVVLFIGRRRRRRKLELELKPKPELIQEPKPELEAKPEPPEIYCRSCGKPIDAKSVYCEFCGTKVEE